MTNPLERRATSTRSRLVLIAIATLAAAACSSPGADTEDQQSAADQDTSAVITCEPAAARQVVLAFGARMKQVPLLAPDRVRGRALMEAYEALVTPALLEQWLRSPADAPGRETSSPWPDRIDVDSIQSAGDGTCRVRGTVAYLTSAEEGPGGVAGRRAVTLQLERSEDWRISALELGAYVADAPASVAGDTAGSSRAAAEVIRRYYAAIDAGNYPEAYSLWGDQGRSSGQSLEEFAAGFAATEQVSVELGSPGRVEGAAGSRFVQIPVEVRARLTSGEEQRFSGSYTLRRAVVDGATPEQRRWHIHAADLEESS